MRTASNQVRLALNEVLYWIRWNLRNDYTSASIPLIVDDAGIQEMADLANEKLDEIGALAPPLRSAGNEPLQTVVLYLRNDTFGHLQELTDTATWWASAEDAYGRRVSRSRLRALSRVLWQVKRCRLIGNAERAGEWVGSPMYWEALKDLVNALAVAARRFD